MSHTAPYSLAPDVSADDYLLIGLATCFVKEDGQIDQLAIIEPIPSAAFGALLGGVPTSYTWAIATTLGQVLTESEDGFTAKRLAELPEEAQFCQEFVLRSLSAARTYKRERNRAALADPLEVGTVYKEFNHSTERKRVLNGHRAVTTEDNVKQHAHTHQLL
jgi:hypothetical protein